MRRTSSRLSRTASATPRSACGRQRRIAVRGPLGLDRDRGQGLADLVVELTRDAQPLGLLGSERCPRRLAPGALQSVEHRVERGREGLALGAARIDAGQPPARPVRVDRAHHLGEPEQRRQHTSQQHEVQSDEQRRSRPAGARTDPISIGASIVIGLKVSSNSARTSTEPFARKTHQSNETERPWRDSERGVPVSPSSADVSRASSEDPDVGGAEVIWSTRPRRSVRVQQNPASVATSGSCRRLRLRGATSARLLGARNPRRAVGRIAWSPAWPSNRV